MTNAVDLRRDQASAVRKRILEGALSVIEAGEQPNMRAVAKAAGISERTLYRYYASREQLNLAVLPLLRERASAPMAECVEELPDYIRRLFSTFAQNPQLARALTTASWLPTQLTRTANLQALRAIIDEAFPRVPESERESAAASLRVLYSAAGWVYLCDCGFDLEAAIRHVLWMTQTALDRLREQEGGGGND